MKAELVIPPALLDPDHQGQLCSFDPEKGVAISPAHTPLGPSLLCYPNEVWGSLSLVLQPVTGGASFPTLWISSPYYRYRAGATLLGLRNVKSTKNQSKNVVSERENETRNEEQASKQEFSTACTCGKYETQIQRTSTFPFGSSSSMAPLKDCNTGYRS